jgi:hypothetical protein
VVVAAVVTVRHIKVDILADQVAALAPVVQQVPAAQEHQVKVTQVARTT